MKYLLFVTVAFAAIGCGGGTGAGAGAPVPPPSAAPFGLDVRAPLGPVNLPTPGSGASFQAVAAFPLLNGLAQPVFAAGVPGSNRIAVIEKPGRIKVFGNDAAATNARTILDITSLVEDGGEQGLLGLAFDPNFTTNGFLYVYYSRLGPRQSVISRFTWNTATDLIDPSSERIVLTVDQPDFSNHKAGMIAFGPDGYLYVALGDGGGAGDPLRTGQDRSDLLGNLLRIDVTASNPSDAYTIPASNPFVGDGDPATREEIWAWGLRNPFRFSFDRQTGRLWLGDVGQGEWEEIDLIEAGGNYGWCAWEGNHRYAGCTTALPQSAFAFPIHEYGRADGASVIGGVVYRGSALPALVGRYVYGDYVSGRVWALAWDGNTVTGNEEIGTVDGPVAFGEDNDAEILIVSLNSSSLLRLEDTSGGGTATTQLSQTGIFADLLDLTAAPGFIEYGLEVPFWSDGAGKRRWLAIPNGQRIGFSPTGPWSFPVGTIAVKHFEIELVEGDSTSARRLETRVLVRRASGWEGFTYRWNAAGTEADLLVGGASEVLTIETSTGPRQQLYEYPSRTDCLRCHTSAAGFLLGVRTRQLNRNFDFVEVTDNQLRSYDHIGLFSTSIGAPSQYGAYPGLDDASASLAVRARAYLEVNCAQCHRPNGPTPVSLDLRFDTSDAQMNALGVAPQAGTLGIPAARIVDQGSKETSVLWERMRRLDDTRMPPLSSHRVDDGGVELVGAWIDSL